MVHVELPEHQVPDSAILELNFSWQASCLEGRKLVS